MSRLLFIALLLPALAVAQPASAPPTFSFDLQQPTGPVRYATTEISSVRFLGEEIEGPTLRPGEKVEWITEKDGWIRFKAKDRYGWAPAVQFTETPPAEDP